MVMQLDTLRLEIANRRQNILRQRTEMLDLQRAGKPIKDAEKLLERMLLKVDELCGERDRLAAQERVCYPGTNKAIRGVQRR